MAECKQCGVTVEGAEIKRVAEWAFCSSCFAQLMEASAKKKEEPKEPISVAEVADDASSADNDASEPSAAPGRLAVNFTVSPQLRCQTCKKPITEAESHAFLGNRICAACHEVLSSGFSDAYDRQQSIDEEPEPEAPRVEQVRVDLTAQATCFVCDKWIRKIAAKVRDDHLYCPDCFAKLPPEEEKSEAERETASRCRACDEPADDVEMVETFALCPRCLGTDRDLALKIAKERHLAKMREQLGQQS